jgi:hypothetical protein
MGLHQQYGEAFEELWSVYPKWPIGRSKKKPSSDAFERARKVLKFTAADIAVIKRDIKTRVLTCMTWQPGNKFGPPMFATYCNQRLWCEPYEKKPRGWREDAKRRAEEEKPEPPRVVSPEQRENALAELKRMGMLH